MRFVFLIYISCDLYFWFIFLQSLFTPDEYLFILFFLRKECLPFHLRLTCSSAPPPAQVTCYFHRLLSVLRVLAFSLHGILSFVCMCSRTSTTWPWKLAVGVYASFCQKECQHLANKTHVFQPRFHNSKSRMVCMYLALGMVAQMVKNLLSMREPWAWSLGQEDPLERERQPTPVSLPGKLHGQMSLVGNSPWGHKESGTTGWLTTTTLYFVIICGRNFLFNCIVLFSLLSMSLMIFNRFNFFRVALVSQQNE